MGVAEVQGPALTLKVGFVGTHEGLLHGETPLAEQGVGNQHDVLIGLGSQGFVQLLQHFVRPCPDQVNSSNTVQGLNMTRF